MADSYHFPDNIHVSSSITLKLNDSNYLLWKTQFKSLLSCQKLIGFVNGSITSPPPTHTVVNGDVVTKVTNPQYESWFCTDQLVRPWLFSTLSEEELGYVHNLHTSRQIWISLADNFKKNNIAVSSHSIVIFGCYKKDKFLAGYCRDFTSICDALSFIGKPIDESMKIFGFLNGLGREYDPITTVIQSSMSKFPPPTLNDAVSEVEGFDTKLKSYKDSDYVTPHMAFQTQRSDYNDNYRTRQRGRGRGFGGKNGAEDNSRKRLFSTLINSIHHRRKTYLSDMWHD